MQNDKIGWWKIFFQELSDLDLFTNEDPVIVVCVRYCSIDLVREDLDSILSDWNTHIISGNSRSVGPCGRPDSMFFLPHFFNATDFSTDVSEDDVNQFNCYSDFTIEDYSREFQEFADHFTGGIKPKNVQGALRLYLDLLQEIDDQCKFFFNFRSLFFYIFLSLEDLTACFD